jgi:hypothetical protein
MSVEQVQHSVFVSYAREDHAWVSAAVNLLIAGGAKVFMDVRSITYGDKWQDVLRSKLRDAERVMVFWSRHAAESEWVKEEWTLALEDGKRLVPVPIDETPLPEGLSQFQALTDLMPLLNPSLGQMERPQAYAKPRSFNRLVMLAAAASVLLVVPTLMFLTTGSVEDSDGYIAEYPRPSSIGAGPTVVQPLPEPMPEPEPVPDPVVEPMPVPEPVQPLPSFLEENDWIVIPGGLIVLLLVSWVAIRWLRKRRKARRMADTFDHHISPELAKEIIETSSPDADLGKRVVDMVFAETGNNDL